MPILKDTLILASKAHRGLRGKAGESYILHPLRLALRMKTDPERIVALLHDLIEDTSFDIRYLREVA